MTVVSLTVFLVTGGVLAFCFVGFPALIGQANRLQAQRQLRRRTDPDGADGPVQPTLPDMPD